MLRNNRTVTSGLMQMVRIMKIIKERHALASRRIATHDRTGTATNTDQQYAIHIHQAQLLDELIKKFDDVTGAEKSDLQQVLKRLDEFEEGERRRLEEES